MNSLVKLILAIFCVIILSGCLYHLHGSWVLGNGTKNLTLKMMCTISLLLIGALSAFGVYLALTTLKDEEILEKKKFQNEKTESLRKLEINLNHAINDNNHKLTTSLQSEIDHITNLTEYE